MTPGARIAAAIEILDLYLDGAPVEKALTNWARRSRFAGSKDRAAIRDIVFDCLRRRDSYAGLGGGLTGRALCLGHAKRLGGLDEVRRLFSGDGHAPAPLSEDEEELVSRPFEETNDLPAWVSERIVADLGAEKLVEISAALKERAPVFLRVNRRLATVAQAQDALRRDGIQTALHPSVETALVVHEGARKVGNSDVYRDGLVELQDAAAQAICLDLPPAGRVLDYCAGGGGKVLAYGALHDATLFAHDAHPQRLRDLPNRAARAGVEVRILSKERCAAKAPFDLVICDVPCSGSGAWRRNPEGKWALTPRKLDELQGLQAAILDEAAALVSPGGVLAFVTCSILAVENNAQIQEFMGRNSAFELQSERHFLPGPEGDGFYAAHLTRRSTAP